MPTFSTAFNPPPAISGLTVDADLEKSRIRFTWDVSSVAEVDFVSYNIYRSRDSGATFKLVQTQVNIDNNDWNDYDAPLNVDLVYRITQTNVNSESEPVEAAASLATLQWWVVTPGDEDSTFPIPKVRGANLTSPKVQEIYAPMGRSSRVVVGDVVQEEEGELTFLMMPDNPGMFALLRRLQKQMEGSIVLKSPDGKTHYVQYGDMSRRYTEVPGMQEISIPFFGTGEGDE